VSTARKRVAAIVTWYRNQSHANVLVTKFLQGYELMWAPVHSRLEVASLYVDQVPEDDISRDISTMFGVPIFPTIREALTLGGSQLAVDGVILVGEHGDYPFNEKGQKFYPRRRFFEETVAVFRESGRVVPVFNDKHLAWNWDGAKWMYDTAQELGIPFMAGSSIPITFRCPPVQVPLDAEIEEIVAVGNGPLESYGFHALEMTQCLAERRQGYETGVASVQCLSGGAFWEAWHAGNRWSKDLQEAALAVVPHADGSPDVFYERRRAARRRAAGAAPAQPAAPRQSGAPGQAAAPTAAPEGAEEAFLIQYRDGLRLTVLMLNGYVQQRGVALRIRGAETPLATCFIQAPGGESETNWNFAHLAALIEDFVDTGQPPYPVERTLLTTGILDAAMTSRYEGGQLLETPYLAVDYRPATSPIRQGG
jgi:hypothetical protein